MGQENEEALENIDTWIEDMLREFSDWLIIVEGIKDVLALDNLGVDLPVVHLNKGLSNLDLLEKLWRAEGDFRRFKYIEGLVILTDWDRTGGRLARSLGDKCLSLGIPYDMTMRKRLAMICGKWIKDVESLDTLYITLKEDQRLSLT
ncbi:MAG: hypothetical protein R6V01_11450 [Thermoplasmatota archaeon]